MQQNNLLSIIYQKIKFTTAHGCPFRAI